MSKTDPYINIDSDSDSSDLTSPPPTTVAGEKRTAEDELPDASSRKKRGKTMKSTWSYSRPPKGKELERNVYRQQIWYCSLCSTFDSTNLKRVREHLSGRHNIKVKEDYVSPKEVSHQNVKQMIQNQAGRQAGRDIEQEKHLRAAINLPAFEEALCRLITLRNQPHTMVEWDELRALLQSVNYMAIDVLQTRKAVPILLRNSFVIKQKGLKQKLRNSLSRLIHFSIDCWTAPNHTAYQATVAHFVDSDTKKLVKALIALREFKGQKTAELQAPVFIGIIEEYDIKDKVKQSNVQSLDQILTLAAR
jgi:hypothetical protein